MSVEDMVTAEATIITKLPSPAWVQGATVLWRSLRVHSLLILIVLIHSIGGVLLVRRFEAASDAAGDLYSVPFLVMTAMAAVVFLGAYAIHLRLVVRPTNYWDEFRLAVFERFLTWQRLCQVLPVMLLMPVFGATFTNLKVLIPAVNPFGWDATFAEWDRLLHGGYHPWELLQPILGNPYVTLLINGCYNLWFILAYGVFCWQMATMARSRLRMQYLITFIIVWAVVGNVMATLLSSAGPVYYGRVTGLPDPFAPLMAYLQQVNTVVPVSALGIQEMLWRLYETRGFAVGGGISAMPSLHVAIAFSFVLLGAATSRMFSVLFGIFAVVILIGSVHLGWHYAIDGYVAILMTWTIWQAVGWLLRRPAVERWLWGEATASHAAGADVRPQPAGTTPSTAMSR